MDFTASELKILLLNPLFQGFSLLDLNKALSCLNAKKLLLKKDTFLFEEGEKAELAFLLLEGKIDLVRYSSKGDLNILESFKPGDSLGEAYAIKEKMNYGVSALVKEDGSALALNLKAVLKKLDCKYSQMVITRLVILLADKDLLMKDKLNVLAEKGLKGKVLSFIFSLAHGKKNEYFSIPFSREEMASFLCCDRSSLSRLLSSMAKEGLIEYKKNKFLLK